MNSYLKVNGGFACGLGYLLPDPTYPWGLELRWQQTLGAGETMLGGTILGFMQALGDPASGLHHKRITHGTSFQYRESPLLFLRSLPSFPAAYHFGGHPPYKHF